MEAKTDSLKAKKLWGNKDNGQGMHGQGNNGQGRTPNTS